MVSALELLDKYASTFQKMIQAKVLGSKGSVQSLLRLEKDLDWDFLTAAMDIIGDASAAISHVQQFGLSGPTKYNDLGEKYLRLYGLLSAVYIQQQAVLTIYRIMNVPNLKEIKARFNALQIRKLRHKLSSHGTDYSDPDAAGAKQAYVPLRLNLGDRSVTVIRHTLPMQHEEVDLSAALEAHAKLVVEVMDRVIEKAIGTLFRQHPPKKGEFLGLLSDLRIEKEGGLVVKGPMGAPKIIVTFVGSKSGQTRR